RDDTVQYRAGLYLARPADEAWHPPTAFPVGVLLGAEWCVGAVRPGVILGTVVGGVHDNGVIGNAQFVELVEHLANLLVMHDHPVTVRVLPTFAEILLS